MKCKCKTINYIRTIFNNRKVAQQKNHDKKLLTELISHVTDKEIRPTYEAVIRSQISYMRDQQKLSNNTNMADNYELLLKVSVKVLDNLMIMRNWMGIQPMVGPVDLAYNLSYRYAEKTATTDGDCRMALDVMAHPIAAGAPELATGLALETVHDFQLYGLNISAELIQILSAEIASELINSHLDDIRSFSKIDGVFPIGDSQHIHKHCSKGDVIARIIAREANLIAARTRRGPGNFAIVSPTVLSFLRCTSIDFTMDENIEHTGRIKLVGSLLGDNINVFCDEDLELEGLVTVGYKGVNGEMDTGYVYCPYLVVTESGVVADPDTFQPKLTLKTREGIYKADNAADYYSTFTVDSVWK